MNMLNIDIRLVDGQHPTSAAEVDYAPYGGLDKGIFDYVWKMPVVPQNVIKGNP